MYHRPCRLQLTDTHAPLHVRGKHLILESANRLLERLTLTLELPVPIDLRSERAVADLPEGFVYAIEPHIVSVKKPKYIGGNCYGRLAVVSDLDDGGCYGRSTVVSDLDGWGLS
jgi:hypothetical protein